MATVCGCQFHYHLLPFVLMLLHKSMMTYCLRVLSSTDRSKECLRRLMMLIQTVRAGWRAHTDHVKVCMLPNTDRQSSHACHKHWFIINTAKSVFSEGSAKNKMISRYGWWCLGMADNLQEWLIISRNGWWYLGMVHDLWGWLKISQNG